MPSNPDFPTLEKRFEPLRVALRKQGVKIYNCTPGTKLKAFERGELAHCL